MIRIPEPMANQYSLRIYFVLIFLLFVVLPQYSFSISRANGKNPGELSSVSASSTYVSAGKKSMFSPQIITVWTFEPLIGTTSNPGPNTGSGSANLVGSMVGNGGTATGMNTVSGCGNQTSGTNAWAANPATPGSSNESSGVQFNVNTSGYENIIVSWEQRWSNTSANTCRLQYTTDGGNWVNFTMTSSNTTFCNGSLNNGRFETNTTGDQYRRITVDLSSVTGANDNSNFGVRVVAAHYQNTGQFRQTTNPTTVATAGTWRFDNIKFEGDALSPPALPMVNLSVNINSATEAMVTEVIVTAITDIPVTGNQTVSLQVGGINISDSDYDLPNNVITILSGQTSGNTRFIIADDAVQENTETAVLTLSNPSAGLSLGTVITQNITIENNDCSFLRKVGTVTSAVGAEIPGFDPMSSRIYLVAGTTVEYYLLDDTGTPTFVGTITPGFTIPNNTTSFPNSLSIKGGILAVCYDIRDNTTLAHQIGKVAFYSTTTGVYIHSVNVGYLPDMVVFSPDGNKVLTADEGEPNSYGQGNSFDPEGSVSIIDISNGILNATVQTAGFTAFNSQINVLRNAGVRIFGPGATVAQDVEPEYITFSDDGQTAIITLQENNALALLDIQTATITDIIPLGLKDHNMVGNDLDVSDRDLTSSSGRINLQNWPVRGMYQPDAIVGYTVFGQRYYITANEGDSRDYTGFTEEIRVGSASYGLDPVVFPNATTLKLNENLGRLQVSNATGNLDADNEFERIDVFGARSFSIWEASGEIVYDSGNLFEEITAARIPSFFNSDGTSATFDTRSDNKGPEPEGVVLGYIGGKPYVFIGLERVGDVMVFDVSDPAAPVFIQHINTREDEAVEGLTFVSAEDSPTGSPLLITAAEVSRTLTVYEVGTAIVTQTGDSGTGSLRAVIDCVPEGGVVRYNQPTTSTTVLTQFLSINKNLTIMGQSMSMKPEITVDFTSLTGNSGIIIGNSKTVTFKNIDLKDQNNTSMPAKNILEIQTGSTVKVTDSTVITKE